MPAPWRLFLASLKVREHGARIRQPDGCYYHDALAWADGQRDRFGDALLDTGELDFILRYARGGLVEVGGANGWGAFQLRARARSRKRHVKIISFDSAPWRDQWSPATPVQYGSSKECGGFADRTLYLCWPEPEHHLDPDHAGMALEALRAFEQAGGRRLIYVGEPEEVPMPDLPNLPDAPLVRAGHMAGPCFFSRLRQGGWALVASRPVRHRWIIYCAGGECLTVIRDEIFVYQRTDG